MKIGLGLGALLTMGLIGCGGNSGSTAVTGTGSTSVEVSPAGVATLSFMDLEAVRPDLLASASATLPSGITFNPGTSTYSFNGSAANAGAFNGTISFTAASGVYTETFDLTTTKAVAATASNPNPTQTWVYSGTQVITVVASGSSNTATFATPKGPITAVLTDTSTTPSTVKTYTFTPSSDPSQPLTETWTGVHPTQVTLGGSYAFKQLVLGQPVATLACAMNPSLTWIPASCAGYPNSGTLNISYTGLGVISETTGVTFGPACGEVAFDGASITLGH